MQQRFTSPLDQAFLALWVSLHKDSFLAKYLLPEEDRLVVLPPPVLPPRAPTTKEESNTNTPPVQETKPTIPRIQRTRVPRVIKDIPPTPQPKISKREARAVRRIDREQQTFIDDKPLADWAKRLLGDERISNITLQDILDGIDHYFNTFKRLRKVDPDAYLYFSRVGAPLIFKHTAAWYDIIHAENPTIPNANNLPSFFGAFITKPKEEYRQEVLENRLYDFEFTYFEKPKNFATAAPLDTTVFLHFNCSLNRPVFTKEELKKFPYAGHSWGFFWAVGVLSDGTIRALPCRMNHYQDLPSGDVIHSSSFGIPSGLSKLAEMEKYENAHKFVASQFTKMIAFTSSAITGIQVTIRKDGLQARLGIPVTSTKTFFADREPAVGSTRRKAIIHLRMPHQRQLKSGRVIRIGEHLRGERTFHWREYEVTIGVPGIHFPSVEGFNVPVWIDSINEDDTAFPPPSDKKLVPAYYAARKLAKKTWTDTRPPFHHGEPTSHYHKSTLPDDEPKRDK